MTNYLQVGAESEINLQKAISYLKLGNYQQAEVILKKLTEIEPDNYAAWYYLGLYYDEVGLYHKAYQSYKQSETISPEGFNVLYYGENNYRNSGYNDRRGAECSMCDCCCGLCVLDTCCECMGGDIIACC